MVNKEKKKLLKHLKFVKEPPKTKRFCALCEKMRYFRFNKNIRHSECVCCGSRVSFRDAETYKRVGTEYDKWKKNKENESEKEI